MGILSSLFGIGKITEPVEAVGKVLDSLFTSDEERAHADAVMQKIRQHPGELNLELNKIEAGHRSIFVAGWRPGLGWVCVAGLSVAFVINPFIEYFTETAVNVPTEIMMELVIAMLGLAGLRTVEKLKGKAK